MTAQLAWDSEAWRVERDRRQLEWMCGNHQAVEVVHRLSHIAELWDDIIDGDRKATDTEVNFAFESALIHLQTNPFFAKHHATIMAVIVLAINAWHDANEYQKTGDPEKRMQAFYLRNFGIELSMICAFCCGGYEHLRAVSGEIRDFCRHETYDQWSKEHHHVG